MFDYFRVSNKMADNSLIAALSIQNAKCVFCIAVSTSSLAGAFVLSAEPRKWKPKSAYWSSSPVAGNPILKHILIGSPNAPMCDDERIETFTHMEG